MKTVLFGPPLLVLDNLEQVLTATPEIADLLASCPELTVLATSRTVLRLSGEWVLPVPPMTLPAPRLIPPHRDVGNG